MPSLYNTPSNQPSSRSNQAESAQSENLYSLAFFTVAADLRHLLSIPCLDSNMDKNQRHCFLFYVYGWFFGLGLGLVAAIFSFVENDSIASRVCLTSAVVLSVVVAVFQISLNTCGKKKFSKKCRNITVSVFRISGLFLIMASTLAGTFTSNDPGGLFFICGIFSFACYLMACIGFSVRLYRESKKNSRMDTNIDYQGQVTNAEVHIYPEWIPQVSVIYNRNDDLVQIHSSNGSQACPEIFNANGEPLPILKLPTYSEAINGSIDSLSPRPPEYSRSTQDTAVLDTPSYTIPSATHMHQETDNANSEEDLPPQYQELARETFWAL